MKSYANSFMELIYPEKNVCFICEAYDELIGDRYICRDCEAHFKKLTSPLCRKCSKQIDYGYADRLCSECADTEKYFEESRSPYSYEGLVKKAIYSYKYYNKAYYFKLFGNILVEFMKNTEYTDFDFIVSVPLHRSRMQERGYNQSQLIAKYISEKLSIPYADALKRTRKTQKQSRQSRLSRKRNIINAFETKKSSEKVIHSSVLLVDDIYTTGATVNECARALINSGVSKVYAITIAR